MNHQTITDYSVCSTQELEEMLNAELTSLDPAVSLAILDELAKRTAAAPDTDAAWSSFQKNYLPLEAPLYPDDAPQRKKARVLRFGRTLGAAAVAACLACTLVVQAGGTDILRTMVRWNRDELRISSPVYGESSLLPEAGSQDAASSAASSPAPGDGEDVAPVEMETILPEVTVYATLAEGLAAMDLKALTPTAIPEGYALESVEVQELEVWADLSAQYFNAAGDLLRFSCSCYGEGSVFSTVVPKDEEEVEVYDFHGTTYYFLSNGRYESVNWMEDELTECSISGPVTREELKAMVNSMHE